MTVTTVTHREYVADVEGLVLAWRVNGKADYALQLTEYGAASTVFAPSKEDERSVALAARARKGDYDDGTDQTCNPYISMHRRLNDLQTSFWNSLQETGYSSPTLDWPSSATLSLS